MLDLHQNQFSAFYSIPNSKHLDSLILGFNRLFTLENLDRAPNMTIVDLHNNKIQAFPEGLADLRQLKTLKISNNDLADISPRLSLLQHLVRINIEGNPLRSIKPAMRGAGAE